MFIDLPSTLKKIMAICRKDGASYLVIRDPASIRYLTGCVGHDHGDMIALVSPSRVFLFTDVRYESEVKRLTAKNPNITVIIWDRKDIGGDIVKRVPKGAVLGFEKNNNYSSNSFVLILRAAGRKRGVQVKALNDMLQQVRSIKSETELRILRKAQTHADKAFTLTLPMIKPGVTELAIVQQLNIHLRQQSGSDEVSFATIVASGSNGDTAHATPSERKIRKGEMVTIDFGCTYHGYHSDTTRTVIMGKLKPKLQEIFDVVLGAQEAAEKAAKPGMTGIELDKVARDYIEAAGYGKYFGHGTGHGVGVDIHEKPHVGQSAPCANILEQGMVHSIEPGIYIPGVGGVRIENVVEITRTGARSLSKLPKVIKLAA